MSNYRSGAFNPLTRRVEHADWLDNHFGIHVYGVKFDDGNVYHTWEVGPLALGKYIERQQSVIDWVESWVSHPVGAYSVSALDGLFGMTRDKIAAISRSPQEGAVPHE